MKTIRIFLAISLLICCWGVIDNGSLMIWEALFANTLALLATTWNGQIS